MKKYVFIVLAAVALFSLPTCNAKQSNLKIKTTVVPNDTVKNIKSNGNLNPNFYLKIFRIYTGATLLDESSHVDKVFRIVLYNEEEHITIIVETILIEGEGGPSKLLKQEKLTEEKLKMKEFSMTSVEFIEWVNEKEAKLKINNNCFIVNLENLSFKQCQ